jgi:hypothetical protein
MYSDIVTAAQRGLVMHAVFGETLTITLRDFCSGGVGGLDGAGYSD